MLIASLALSSVCLGLAPQEPEFAKALSKSEVSSLTKKAQALVGALDDYARADAENNRRARERANQAVQKFRTAFNKDWGAKNKKHGDVLKYVGDLRQIFGGVFTYDKPPKSPLGTPQPLEANGNSVAQVIVPKRYRAKNQYRCVAVLPTVEGGAAKPRDYWEATWKGSGLDSTILCLPNIELDLDDWNAAEDGVERQRIGTILAPLLGQVVRRSYNVDRDLLFLDSGNGSSQFGLRLASYFPSRFAGIVIRDPQMLPEGMRYESLRGLNVLLMDNGNGNAEKLAKILNDLKAGAATVMKPKGAYPYGESQADIDAWIGKQRREMYPMHVTIANNSDSFRKAYWVEMGPAEVLASLSVEERPLLDVKADRSTNRIEVTARNVDSFALYLNDAIVDLDKPFTVVINGKAVPEQRSRSLATLEDYVMRGDPGFLCTTVFQAAVPEGD